MRKNLRELTHVWTALLMSAASLLRVSAAHAMEIEKFDRMAGVEVQTPATPSDAFDQITYRDTGGFGAGGRGISLTVTGSGNLEAQVLKGPSRVRTLQGQELAELHAVVAAVDWSHVEHDYRTPGAADLVTRNLTIVIRGQTHETHADSLAKLPDALAKLFGQLDALYRRSVRPEEK